MPWRPFEKLSVKELAQRRAVRGRRAKFLVDESMGPNVTWLLRSSGWNVKGTDELGLNGRSDRDIFRAARHLGRILLTHDHDFLNDRWFPPKLNPGLVVLPGAEGNRKLIVSVLDRLLKIVGSDQELWSCTKILIAGDSEWTVRTYERSEGRVVESRYRFCKHGMEYWKNET